MDQTDLSKQTIDAGRDLLDRQIVDRDGLMAGKVDDFELTIPEGDRAGRPFVSATLSGPGALAHVLGGRTGRWIESVHRRLHPDADPGPARVSFGVVKKLANQVELAVARDELDVMLLEDWARETVVSKIPGAGP